MSNGLSQSEGGRSSERKHKMDEKQRVLVVDDELPVCKSVAKAIAGEYEVDTALSAEEALEMQAEAEYDLIVTDLMMPGLSGMDLLRTLGETGSATKVVMITGYPSVRTAVMSIKLGAFDYIPKPFTPGEIRNPVRRALASRQAAGGDEAGMAKKQEPPQDVYTISDNSWARVEDSGMVRIGVHGSLLGAVRGPVSVEMPEIGDMRYQGEVCARLADLAGNVHRVWTPVSGRVKAVNKRVGENISHLVGDPYGDGWVIVLEPTHLDEDLERLTPRADGK